MINFLIGLGAVFGGAILGSFTTMLVHRLHYDETGIWGGRSRCPQCRHVLGILQLIPVFSWLFQRGKCAFCKKKIPYFYPLTELVFITTFFLFVQKFYSTDVFYPLLIAVFFLLVIFIYDVRFMEVDRRISFPAIGLALIWSFFRELSFQEYLIGGGIGFLFYFVQFFYSRKKEHPWVGEGDIELGLLCGLLLGWKYFLVMLFLAYILGVFYALPLLFLGKANAKTALPMGAFLMPAILAFLYAGENIFSWYINMLGISF
ncbi:prepilin peptidase [Candidatus Gracilibacteria bacterium]|nr:prepilin peptidase [Candidatus Gracilibacteria bacterium]